MPRLLHHISVRYPFRRNLKGLWAKKGKYEYCYHFSSRQNHPK